MSSNPIIYWITEAPHEQLVAKVDQLVRDISDKDRFGYDLAATIAMEVWPTVKKKNRTLFVVGILLTMLSVHRGFYEETQNAEGQNMADFHSFMQYLHERLSALMSANEHFLNVIYSLVFFACQHKDPWGQTQRALCRMPPLRPMPERGVQQ